MGRSPRILAVVDPDVDGVAARAMLAKMCQSGELVVADAPGALDGLVQSEPWATILHCGQQNSSTVDEIDRLRSDLAIITLDVDAHALTGRSAPVPEPRRELSPGAVVWSAFAVAIGVSVGSWFLVSNLVVPQQPGTDNLFATEKVEELLDYSTASGAEDDTPGLLDNEAIPVNMLKTNN